MRDNIEPQLVAIRSSLMGLAGVIQSQVQMIDALLMENKEPDLDDELANIETMGQ
jgi:hypothetical protein